MMRLWAVQDEENAVRQQYNSCTLPKIIINMMAQFHNEFYSVPRHFYASDILSFACVQHEYYFLFRFCGVFCAVRLHMKRLI